MIFAGLFEAAKRHFFRLQSWFASRCRSDSTRPQPWHAYAWTLYMVATVRVAWMCDDAYIGLRPVANMLQGYGLVSNPGERVQAFTSPLWTLLTIPLQAISHEVYFSTMLLSLVVSGCAGWILIHSAKRPVDAMCVGLVLSFSRSVTDYSTSGLENPLIHLMVVIVLVLYRRASAVPRATFWLFFCSALLILTRFDSVLLVLPPLAHHLLCNRSSKHLRNALLGLTPLALWILFSFVYYGFPLPNTAYAKLNLHVPRRLLFAQGFAYLLDSVQRDPLTLLTIVGSFVACVVGTWSRATVVMLGPLLHLAYVITVGGDFMTGRFFSTAVFVALFAMANWLLKEFMPFHVLALGAVAAVVVITVPHSPFGIHQESEDIPPNGIADERGWYQGYTGLWRNVRNTDNRWGYRNHPFWRRGVEMLASGEKVIVDQRLGLAGVAAGPTVHILDDAGLTDALLARIPTLRSATRWRIGHFYRAIPDGYVDTLKSGTNRIADPCIRQYYDKLAIVIRGPIFSWTRFKTIAALNWGTYDHLLNPGCQ